MAKTNAKVKVEILKPFHIGIDKPVHYKPGLSEVDPDLAQRLISKGFAKACDEKEP